MGVQYLGDVWQRSGRYHTKDGRVRKAIKRPWVAKGRIRETCLDVYLGAFETEAEARAAVDAFYERRGGRRWKRRDAQDT